MTANRIMALLALTCLAAFLLIVALRVGRIDLTIVIVIGLGFVVYDMWDELVRRSRR